jgi:hypothetical protein
VGRERDDELAGADRRPGGELGRDDVLEANRARTDRGRGLYVLVDGALELCAVRVGQAAKPEGAAGASLPHQLEVVEVVAPVRFRVGEA